VKPFVKSNKNDFHGARAAAWPGARVSIKGRIHFRRLVFSPKLTLAVTQRTIHCGYLFMVDTHYADVFVEVVEYL
jgi:hypothetical protein